MKGYFSRSHYYKYRNTVGNTIIACNLQASADIVSWNHQKDKQNQKPVCLEGKYA